MTTLNSTDYQVIGSNETALFTLKAYRGEGMLLLAMNWKESQPPKDFVGFSIEYKEPNGDEFFVLKNRLSFANDKGKVSTDSTSSLLAPFQKFRWVHFPRNANLKGIFTYKVKPVFMNDKNELSYGESQIADVELQRETYPDILNVAFTRGYVSSQAFVDRYKSDGGVAALLPPVAKAGLDYVPTHPEANEALTWMGFEATAEILKLLDDAIVDGEAEVKVVAYDLNLPEVVTRLEKLGERLKIIIDNSTGHGDEDSAETEAAKRLSQSSKGNVKRQHLGNLQHNKTIVVNGAKMQVALCGSTNFSWRGFYVQANNALIVRGKDAIQPFIDAFNNYWKFDDVKNYGQTISAEWNALPLNGIDAKISFSPHSSSNALLDKIAADIGQNTKSNLLYSLAFLYQTDGPIKDALGKLTANDDIFVYGISDKKTGGLDFHKPNGNISPVYASELSKNAPEPFKSEPNAGIGTRMHHKFVIIDFNTPDARVYLGSYNFSSTADRKNGENLLLIKDKKIAIAYMIEALRIFDHYHFRVSQKESAKTGIILSLSRPPRNPEDKAWWQEYYTDAVKIKDRELFY